MCCGAAGLPRAAAGDGSWGRGEGREKKPSNNKPPGTPPAQFPAQTPWRGCSWGQVLSGTTHPFCSTSPPPSPAHPSPTRSHSLVQVCLEAGAHISELAAGDNYQWGGHGPCAGSGGVQVGDCGSRWKGGACRRPAGRRRPRSHPTPRWLPCRGAACAAARLHNWVGWGGGSVVGGWGGAGGVGVMAGARTNSRLCSMLPPHPQSPHPLRPGPAVAWAAGCMQLPCRPAACTPPRPQGQSSHALTQHHREEEPRLGAEGPPCSMHGAQGWAVVAGARDWAECGGRAGGGRPAQRKGRAGALGLVGGGFRGGRPGTSCHGCQRPDLLLCL